MSIISFYKEKKKNWNLFGFSRVRSRDPLFPDANPHHNEAEPKLQKCKECNKALLKCKITMSALGKVRWFPKSRGCGGGRRPQPHQ